MRTFFDFRVRFLLLAFLVSSLEAYLTAASNAQNPTETVVAPILREFCFDCHSNGEKEGNLSLDLLMVGRDEAALKSDWLRVLQQLRSDRMPPPDAKQPGDEQVAIIKKWILEDVFKLDLEKTDPGTTRVHRLNRAEYRNTVRDLIGVDYNTDLKFPADDTGHGFDNMSEVLSISPLLLEKYFDAAREIIGQSVPTSSAKMQEIIVKGDQFKSNEEAPKAEPMPDPANRTPGQFGFGAGAGRRNVGNKSVLELSYYDDRKATSTVNIEIEGEYKLRLDIRASETYAENLFDKNRCEFTFLLDGELLVQREFVRQGGADFWFEFSRVLTVGTHELTVQIRPLSSEEKFRRLRIDVKSVTFSGPTDPRYFVKPKNYDHFFPTEVPTNAADRRGYAMRLLESFAERAVRRSVDASTKERLVDLAAATYEGGATFEAGIAKAMTALLVSPRFIFRDLRPELMDDSDYPQVDEYSLASRLSYFLWSTMPDEHLMQLSREHRLRENYDAQVQRMLNDDKAKAFTENFVGQWLKARSIESIPINARAVNDRETAPDPEADARRKRFFELVRIEKKTEEEQKEFDQLGQSVRRGGRGGRGSGIDLTPEIRRAMRRETEMLFEYVFRENRSLLELVDCDYTFLNQTLANHYQISGVEGDQMRLVQLPADSLRGGLLTQGTILAVTSNPDRTSPVKRGLFVLENLLGAPPPAAPPDIPALEEVKQKAEGKKLSLRETLAIHRESALCSSCHNRMDPLGLALENFNAMGRFREKEFGELIDVKSQLATGEAFESIKGLKRILVTARSRDIYRCITEKMLAYSLGREVQVVDIPTVDRIVDQLEKDGGKASTLLFGVLHSDAFQRMRRSTQ